MKISEQALDHHTSHLAPKHSACLKFHVFQINRAMEEMVKTNYPEAVASRHAEQAKAQATKDFHAMVFSAGPKS